MPEIDAKVGTEGRSVILRFPLGWVVVVAVFTVASVWFSTYQLGTTIVSLRDEVLHLRNSVDGLQHEMSSTRERARINERLIQEHKDRLERLEALGWNR